MREITIREADAKKRENKANYLINNQEKELNEKARQLTSATRKSLELEQQKREKELKNSYKLKEYKLYAVTFGGLLYSFYVTVLTIMTTIRFKADLQALIEGICSICLTIWDNVLVWANTVSGICNKIPNEVAEVVIVWIVKLLFIILILALIMGAVGWIIYKLVEFYRSRFADRISVVVSLICFSLLVWFGDHIGALIKWNLLLFFLMIQVAYVFIRMYVESRKF